MPAGEVIDYIKLINESRRKEAAMRAEMEAQENASSGGINDVTFAGNSLPGSFF